MKHLKLIIAVLALAALVSTPAFFSQAPTSPLLPTQVETTAVSGAVTDTTATDGLAAPATGLRWYVTQLQCLNVSASTQDSAILKSSTTSMWQVACTPGSVSTVIKFNPPLRQPDTATKLTMTATASATSNYFIMAGYKGR